jgi:hypothetical protein
MIPRQYLGLWLKEVPAADVGHKVLRYDHADLVSYCGRRFPAEGAARPLLGVRLCPDCLTSSRRQEKDLKALAKRFNTKRNYATERE